MPDRDDDLWPAEAFKELALVAPVQILREQANALTTRTRGTLRGKVESTTEGKNVLHTLIVEVPALDYNAALIRVRHPVNRLYPVMAQILGGTSAVTLGMASTEANFRQLLRRGFSSDRVTGLLSTL